MRACGRVPRFSGSEGAQESGGLGQSRRGDGTIIGVADAHAAFDLEGRMFDTLKIEKFEAK